jgi:hypothetical protein
VTLARGGAPDPAWWEYVADWASTPVFGGGLTWGALLAVLVVLGLMWAAARW